MPTDPLEAPQPPPSDPAEDRRRRLKVLAGVGIPALIGSIVAGMLGIPWWIIMIFLVVIALGVLLNS